jgi:effector-binding domain-containing protein
MKALKIVGILIGALFIVVIVLGLLAPKKYYVERSITINAPSEVVFNHIKYWRNWPAWSPWASRDSSIQTNILGTDGEVGSVYQWKGNPKTTGTGEMTNTGITEGEELKYNIKFKEPWESEADGFVDAVKKDGSTTVTWTFYGKSSFPENVFLLFMNMDKTVGKDFQEGLTKMKDISEQEYQAISRYNVKETIFPATNYAVIQKVVKYQDIQQFFASSFPKISEVMEKKRIRMSGAPVGLYFDFDEQSMTTNMAAAIPIRSKLTAGDVRTITVPRSAACYVDYYGSYSGLLYPHEAIDFYLKKNGLTYQSPVIEEYVTDPMSEPDSTKWLTKIYYLVK